MNDPRTSPRASAYLARMPAAISGAGGHDATFKAAIALVQGFDMAPEQALPLLQEWNRRCQPPWTEPELRHKLADASKAHSAKPRGYLLAQASHTQYPIAARSAIKVGQQKHWPRFEPPFTGDDDLHSRAVDKLAHQRHLSRQGLYLAASRDLFWVAAWKGLPAWIVTDAARRNAQARRMDGKVWEGIEAKAQTLPGSTASWPIGVKEASRFPIILLVEGGPDLLAAHHFIHAQGREADVAAVAMLGANHSIPDEALDYFVGKRVRIIPHADKAGRLAALRWEAQLTKVGATVDAVDLGGLLMADGSPAKDLNDLTRIDPKHLQELADLIPNETLEP